MICVPTVTLAAIFAAVFIANILKRNAHLAMITFFFGLFCIIAVSIACNNAGQTAGWVAVAAIVLFMILVQLTKLGVFEAEAVVDPCAGSASSGPVCPPPAPPAPPACIPCPEESYDGCC
jgi:hypothetical protein